MLDSLEIVTPTFTPPKILFLAVGLYFPSPPMEKRYKLHLNLKVVSDTSKIRKH